MTKVSPWFIVLGPLRKRRVDRSAGKKPETPRSIAARLFAEAGGILDEMKKRAWKQGAFSPPPNQSCRRDRCLPAELRSPWGVSARIAANGVDNQRFEVLALLAYLAKQPRGHRDLTTSLDSPRVSLPTRHV